MPVWMFDMPRSAFGKWIKSHGVSTVELSEMSGVPRTTISSLATGEHKRPTRLTGRKLMKAIREIEPNAKESDFWDV